MVAKANCIALELTVVQEFVKQPTGSLVAHIMELGRNSLSCQLAGQKLVLFLFCSLLAIIGEYGIPIRE